MSEPGLGSECRIQEGEPAGVTPSEWRTWLARGAAGYLPDGRGYFMTRDGDGGTLLVPVRVVRDTARPR